MAKTPNKAPQTKQGATSPAILLTIGNFVWKGFALWGNIDFILSLGEDKVTVILEAILNWGWAVLAGVGAVLWFARRKLPKSNRTEQWAMLAVVAALAFMFGTLVAAHQASSVTDLLKGWGITPSGCGGVVDTARLAGFTKKYKFALACGMDDATIDRLEDARIAISSPFNIGGGDVTVEADFPQSVLQLLKPGETRIWHALLIVPKTEDISRIKRLSDVVKDGGKVIMPRYGVLD
jgi:hypothetical protein